MLDLRNSATNEYEMCTANLCDDTLKSEVSIEEVRTKRPLSAKGLKIEIMPSNHSVENSPSFRIKTGDETLKIRPKMPREC